MYEKNKLLRDKKNGNKDQFNQLIKGNLLIYL